ncbi:hypothetical protein HYW66_01795 [Candidatus Microgenomates bacterium]|nr:hypothetical protein [Candidatus Microgenomates bacterium]
MHSFLIIGGTPDKRREKALEFAKSYGVSQFDILVIEPTTAGSIGIDKVREVKAKLALKPFNSPFKLGLFLDFDTATIEAQNAFLKTLEEPPANTIIVLTAHNKDLLLPTVVSRCQVITLATSHEQLATSEFSVFSFQFSVLLTGGVGEKLKLAEDVGKNREEAAAWLEKMIIFIRQKLAGNHSNPNYLNFLKSFQKTHTLLSTTNVNPRFALENLFLSLIPLENGW